MMILCTERKYGKENDKGMNMQMELHQQSIDKINFQSIEI